MDIERKTNGAMEMLNEWCKTNNMKISVSKTKFALMKDNLVRDPIIEIGVEHLRRYGVNNLEIYLGERMNFHNHIQKMCGRATKIIHKIISEGKCKYRIPLHMINYDYTIIQMQ